MANGAIHDKLDTLDPRHCYAVAEMLDQVNCPIEADTSEPSVTIAPAYKRLRAVYPSITFVDFKIHHADGNLVGPPIRAFSNIGSSLHGDHLAHIAPHIPNTSCPRPNGPSPTKTSRRTMTIVTIAATAIRLTIPPTYAYVNCRRTIPGGQRKMAKTLPIDAPIVLIIG